MKCFFCNQELTKNKWGECMYLCFNPECIIDVTFANPSRHMVRIVNKEIIHIRFLFPAKNGTYGVFRGDNENETFVLLMGEDSIREELVLNIKLNSGNDAIRAVNRFEKLLYFL